MILWISCSFCLLPLQKVKKTRGFSFAFPSKNPSLQVFWTLFCYNVMNRGNLDEFPIWDAGILNHCGPLPAFPRNRLHYEIIYFRPWEMRRATKSWGIDNDYRAAWMVEYERAAKDLLIFNFQEKFPELINNHFSVCLKKTNIQAKGK